jgi:hypothetical protein
MYLQFRYIHELMKQRITLSKYHIHSQHRYSKLKTQLETEIR